MCPFCLATVGASRCRGGFYRRSGSIGCESFSQQKEAQQKKSTHEFSNRQRRNENGRTNKERDKEHGKEHAPR